MKSSLHNLLSWVWQFLLSWITSVATGKHLPLCSERTAKMGIKATDPEMAVGHEKEEMARSEVLKLVVKNEQETDLLLISDTREEVKSVMTGDIEGIGLNEMDTNLVETNNGESGSEMNTDLVVMDINDSNIMEAITDLFIEENTPLIQGEDTEGAENEDGSGSNTLTEDDTGMLLLFATDGSVDAVAPSNVENGDAKEDKNKNENEHDTDEDSEEEDDDDTKTADGMKVTWLIDLSSKTSYKDVLCPQYYCLNFNTVAPLEVDTVRTAIKQLRRLIPWLGLGLRRQKEAMWLCLYPEDNINFQTSDDEGHQWYVVSNCQEHYIYFDSGCICTFRLMKDYPCIECQRHTMETQINTSAGTSGSISNLVSCESSAKSAAVTKDNSKILCAPHGNGACAQSCSSEKADNVHDPSVIISKSDMAAAEKGNKDTPSSHYYRLIFGIPRPLADETLVDSICDNFVKELNNIIERTKNVNRELEKKDDCDKTEIISENGDCNVNLETNVENDDYNVNLETNAENGDHNVNLETAPRDDMDDNMIPKINSSASDHQLLNQQPDNIAHIPDDSTNNAEVSDSKDDEVIHQSVNNNDEKDDEIKASIQQQLTILENILVDDKEKEVKEKNEFECPNNNVTAIDRNTPHIQRTVELSSTRNFMNKCKSERVTFVSGFTTCVNTAVANILVKYGMKKDTEDFRVGHVISTYYNLDDLSDHEWRDHDYDENGDDDDDDDDERRKRLCCKAITANLNTNSKEWHEGFWERVQLVHQKCWSKSSESRSASSLQIPLTVKDNNEKDARFPYISHQSANLLILNISDCAPKFSRQMENIESLTLQQLAPILIFLMTHNISLCHQNNSIKFSFYNQAQFISNPDAHHYADEIVSNLEKSLVL